MEECKMPRSTRPAVAADRRPALLETYLYVAGNWALTAEDVWTGLGLDLKDARSRLAKLTRDGLLYAEHVNGEKALTYQSDFDCENEHRENWEALATAKFNETYPEPVAKAPARKGGANGPRYSADQIAVGIEARRSGANWEVVAQSAGVKAASYFSRVVKEANGGKDPKGQKPGETREQAVRKAAKKSAAKAKALGAREARKQLTAKIGKKVTVRSTKGEPWTGKVEEVNDKTAALRLPAMNMPGFGKVPTSATIYLDQVVSVEGAR